MLDRGYVHSVLGKLIQASGYSNDCDIERKQSGHNFLRNSLIARISIKNIQESEAQQYAY